MGSDQSSQPPAGAPGSRIKSQRDEDIPYTSYSISKPIAGGKPFTVMILSFWTDRSGQTVQTQIRLLLEQSDLGLHCLLAFASF